MTSSGLRAVYQERRILIERLIRARTNSADEAQEVMQELWLRIEQVRPGPIADPVAYVMRMALNMIVDRLLSQERKRMRETNWVAMQPSAAEFPNQETKVMAADELARVRQLLDQMPATMSRALVMFRLERLAQKDIAAELGMSVSGVEKLLARAYRQLTEFQQTATSEAHTKSELLGLRSTHDAG